MAINIQNIIGASSADDEGLQRLVQQVQQRKEARKTSLANQASLLSGLIDNANDEASLATIEKMNNDLASQSRYSPETRLYTDAINTAVKGKRYAYESYTSGVDEAHRILTGNITGLNDTEFNFNDMIENPGIAQNLGVEQVANLQQRILMAKDRIALGAGKMSYKTDLYTDIDVNAGITRAEKTLEGSVIGLRSDNIIDDQELAFIMVGDIEGLKAYQKDRIGRRKAEIGEYKSKIDKANSDMEGLKEWEKKLEVSGTGGDMPASIFTSESFQEMAEEDGWDVASEEFLSKPLTEIYTKYRRKIDNLKADQKKAISAYERYSGIDWMTDKDATTLDKELLRLSGAERTELQGAEEAAKIAARKREGDVTDAEGGLEDWYKKRYGVTDEAAKEKAFREEQEALKYEIPKHFWIGDKHPEVGSKTLGGKAKTYELPEELMKIERKGKPWGLGSTRVSKDRYIELAKIYNRREGKRADVMRELGFTSQDFDDLLKFEKENPDIVAMDMSPKLMLSTFRNWQKQSPEGRALDKQKYLSRQERKSRKQERQPELEEVIPGIPQERPDVRTREANIRRLEDRRQRELAIQEEMQRIHSQYKGADKATLKSVAAANVDAKIAESRRKEKPKKKYDIVPRSADVIPGPRKWQEQDDSGISVVDVLLRGIVPTMLDKKSPDIRTAEPSVEPETGRDIGAEEIERVKRIWPPSDEKIAKEKEKRIKDVANVGPVDISKYTGKNKVPFYKARDIIMKAENRHKKPYAVNRNRDGTRDYGLMQINEAWVSSEPDSINSWKFNADGTESSVFKKIHKLMADHAISKGMIDSEDKLTDRVKKHLLLNPSMNTKVAKIIYDTFGITWWSSFASKK